MGRTKGYTVSEETKAKIKKAKKTKKESGPIDPVYEKQILHITGKEVNAFQFWPLLRQTLRPLHQYILCKKIEREIVQPAIWNDLEKIKTILDEYFIIKKKKISDQVKKKIAISDEERRRRLTRLENARRAKGV